MKSINQHACLLCSKLGFIFFCLFTFTATSHQNMCEFSTFISWKVLMDFCLFSTIVYAWNLKLLRWWVYSKLPIKSCNKYPVLATLSIYLVVHGLWTVNLRQLLYLCFLVNRKRTFMQIHYYGRSGEVNEFTMFPFTFKFRTLNEFVYSLRTEFNCSTLTSSRNHYF